MILQPEDRWCSGKRLTVNVFYPARPRQRVSKEYCNDSIPDPSPPLLFFSETVENSRSELVVGWAINQFLVLFHQPRP